MNIIYYTHSRKMGAYCIPISIQSIYLRNYASSNSYAFSLPVTEYPVFSCYFSLIQKLAYFGRSQPAVVICTTIFIFQELRKNSTAYNELTQYKLNIFGILEGVSGSIDIIIETISEFDFINNLVASHEF